MICSMSNVGGGGGESSLQIQFLGIDAFKVRFFVFMVSSHFIILEVGRIWPEKDTSKSIVDSWGYCCSLARYGGVCKHNIALQFLIDF